ncbi:hypothetical protein DFH09DRAFT_1142486 [Mycena vulgaris]|nr:hypothetical protein DFH09DRAFT_1142486 [Mycena vulgaris]
MFTFTKLPVCVMLALLSVKSVQGAPIDIKGIIESILDNLPDETPVMGGLVQTGSVSDVAASTATASGVFTVVTSVGGPAITLAPNGTQTVWNGATYTINANDAAATSVANPANTTDTTITFTSGSADSVSVSGSSSTDSASATSSGSVSASTTTSTSPSGASSASSAKSSTSGTTKPNSGTALKPVELSTPLARGLFTVAVWVVFGAWCL